MDDEQAIELCIALARSAFDHGNEPFGSVIVRDGEVIAEAENTVLTDFDPTAHAEANAIRRACGKLRSLDLSNCTVFASAEPCWSCAAAIRRTGISRVVYAANTPSVGSHTSTHPILSDSRIARFGPPPEIVPGVLADRSEQLLREIGWRR
jgi:tRNA(adenine34) deaminase